MTICAGSVPGAHCGRGAKTMLLNLFKVSKPNESDADSRLASLPHVQPDPALRPIVLDAWACGQAIDIKDAVYGPAHWKDNKPFHDEGFPYYCFLAGFVRSQSCKRVFEIGTHYGGSTLAMSYGGATDILTVDISDLNQALHGAVGITKLTGDANSSRIIKESVAHFGGRPIDLLYIDAAHKFAPTTINLGLYCFLLKPRLAIIDDILLNPEMRNVWNALQATHGTDAINCVDVVPEIRAPNVGFGLLRLRE